VEAPFAASRTFISLQKRKPSVAFRVRPCSLAAIARLISSIALSS
jgi:hypothetical protein